MKNTLTKQVGPLPLWGWLVAVLGAWYVYSKYKSGSSSSDTSGNTGTDGQSVPGSNYQAGDGSFSGGTTAPGVSPPSPVGHRRFGPGGRVWRHSEWMKFERGRWVHDPLPVRHIVPKQTRNPAIKTQRRG